MTKAFTLPARSPGVSTTNEYRDEERRRGDTESQGAMPDGGREPVEHRLASGRWATDVGAGVRSPGLRIVLNHAADPVGQAGLRAIAYSLVKVYSKPRGPETALIPAWTRTSSSATSSSVMLPAVMWLATTRMRSR